MSSASDTTLRRKQRTLFADRIIQQETFDKGWKTHIVLEGGNAGLGAMTYPPFYNMVNGSLETTSAELAAYRASVPSQASTPDAPTSVLASRGNTEATVTFTVPNNNGAPITLYTVTSSPGNITASGSTSTITVSGLTNGIAYTFTVVATNREGNSPASLPSNSVIPATVPGAPTGVSAVAGDAQAIVTFTAPVTNGGTTITGYTVTSSPDGITVSGSASPLTIAGLTNDTPYTFTVVATNSVGDSVSSAASNSVTPTIPPPPNAPTLTYLLASSSEVFAYVTAGSGTTTNYDWTTDGGSTTNTLNPPDVISPVTLPSLSNGTLYSVQLAGTNSGGSSALSNTLTVTPNNTTAPAAWLEYDPNNVSSYSGTGASVSNVGSFGTMTGIISGSVAWQTGTNTNRNVFNMTGGHIDFGNFNFGNAFTIMAWIRPSSKNSINTILANGPANVNTPGFKFGWNTWQTNNRRLLFENGNGLTAPGDWTVPSTEDNTIVYGEWQHVVCIFDRVAQRVVFMRNGVPVSITGITTAPNMTVDRPTFRIGNYTSGGYSMLGELGVLQVYNSALTAYQVASVYATEQSSFNPII